MIAEAKLMEPARMAALMREADEIIAMTVATIRTLRNRP